MDLTDRDRISDTLSLVGEPAATATGADQFITRNQFAGPQIGSIFSMSWGKFSLDWTTKLAAGITHQDRIIEGSPLLSASPTSPMLLPGPLLALSSNIGRETAERVTLVPEIGIKSHWAVTEWCSVSLGYKLIYWNKVLCPGDQMDGHVNITELPFNGPMVGSPARIRYLPIPIIFAQGVDVSVRFSF